MSADILGSEQLDIHGTDAVVIGTITAIGTAIFMLSMKINFLSKKASLRFKECLKHHTFKERNCDAKGMRVFYRQLTAPLTSKKYIFIITSHCQKVKYLSALKKRKFSFCFFRKKPMSIRRLFLLCQQDICKCH